MITSVRHSWFSNIRGDVLAGLVVALALIPETIAFSIIAGFEVHTALRSGEVERTLCDYRAEHGMDLLVMGAYGHSVNRRFLVGSTATSVMRNATVPVLLLR